MCIIARPSSDPVERPFLMSSSNLYLGLGDKVTDSEAELFQQAKRSRAVAFWGSS